MVFGSSLCDVVLVVVSMNCSYSCLGVSTCGGFAIFDIPYLIG